jgi:hypothetical protein
MKQKIRRENKTMIKNTNGNSYKILKESGKYLLLENQGENGNKYVVCFNYSETIETWQQGSYFDSLEEAENYYNKKIGD